MKEAMISRSVQVSRVIFAHTIIQPHPWFGHGRICTLQIFLRSFYIHFHIHFGDAIRIGISLQKLYCSKFQSTFSKANFSLATRWHKSNVGSVPGLESFKPISPILSELQTHLYLRSLGPDIVSALALNDDPAKFKCEEISCQ